ncbi:hypothetical protein M3Y94_01256600 [Aphelenchoides besseyi]|nr:hypothetical protein M3Y94_01256600 [Aphelenchoides besseyi]KAI6219465.1 hypothetical protein M3Y95_01114100 [Aphelenchoides besseyi]
MSDDKKKDESLEEVLKKNGYTLEWVMDQLEKNDAPFRKARGSHKIKETEIKSIGDGLGYCAQIFKTTFKFDAGDEETKDYSIVIKLPTDELIADSFKSDDVDKEMQEHLSKLAWELHNRECDAHEVLKELRATSFPITDVYGWEKHDDKRNGILLMEDVSDKGKPVEALDSLTSDQCVNLSVRFADFQAFVEHLPVGQWREMFKDSVHIRKQNEKEVKNKLKHVLEFRPEDQLNVVQNYMDMNLYEFAKYALRDYPEKLEATSLLHGDAWSHNVFFNVKDDGSIGNEPTAIIDWATLFEGNPLYDISRFLFCCTDGETRREIQQKLLDTWYNRYSKTLADHNLKPRFTREQADELYELASIRQGAALIELFQSDGLPLFEKKDDKESIEKGERLWQRLRLAFEDIAELFRKYDILKKFPKSNDDDNKKQ